MKSSLLPLLILVGCHSTKEITLDAADLAAVQARNRAECLGRTAQLYQGFSDTSAGAWASADWQRNDAYRHELKQGTTVDTSHDIRVWKNDGTNLYLLITKKIGVSSTNTYFLRIPKSSNTQMVSDIQNLACTQDSNFEADGDLGGPLTATYNYRVTLASGHDQYYDTYSFNFANPVYVGGQWGVRRTIHHFDSTGVESSAANTLTSTFVVVTGQADLSTTPSDYTTQYCDLVDSGTAPHFVAPYNLGTCPTALPGGWDLTI